MSNMRGFDAAQRAYDAMTPPDDGPYECPECGGSGTHHTLSDVDVHCLDCNGFGWIDETGEPFDPHAKERAECEYADYLRQRAKDDALATYRGGVDPEES